MRFVCSNCQAKYSIADERVENKVVTLGCQKCGHKITVRGPVTKPVEPKAAGDATLSQIQPIQRSQPVPDFGEGDDDDEPQQSTRIASLSELERMRQEALTDSVKLKEPVAPAPPKGVWMLLINQQQLGPYTLDDVKAKVNTQEANARTYAWKDGMPDWVRMASIPELSALLPPTEKPKASLAVADLVDPRIQTGESTKPAFDTKKRKPAQVEQLFDDEPLSEPVPFEPPMQTSEPPPRDSTRAAISASGLIDARRRQRTIMLIAVVAVALLFIAVILDFAGIITIPAFGKVYNAVGLTSTPEPTLGEPQYNSDNLTEEERRRIREGLLGKKKDDVTLEAARAKDGVDTAPMTKVVEANLGDVRTCFDRSTKRGAQVAGRLDVELTIAKTGAVSDVIVKSVKHKDTEFAECIVAAAKAWKFAPLPGDPVTVEYPFILSTGN